MHLDDQSCKDIFQWLLLSREKIQTKGARILELIMHNFEYLYYIDQIKRSVESRGGCFLVLSLISKWY